MMNGVKENGLEDSDKVVRAVLTERHAQEARELEKRFSAEKKIMVDDALSKLAEKYERQREELLKKQEAELEALQVGNALWLALLSSCENMNA